MPTKKQPVIRRLPGKRLTKQYRGSVWSLRIERWFADEKDWEGNRPPKGQLSLIGGDDDTSVPYLQAQNGYSIYDTRWWIGHTETHGKGLKDLEKFLTEALRRVKKYNHRALLRR